MPTYTFTNIDDPDDVIERIMKYSERPEFIEIEDKIYVYTLSQTARMTRNWSSNLIYGNDGTVSKSLDNRRIKSDKDLEIAYKELNLRPATDDDIDKAMSQKMEANKKASERMAKEARYQKLIKDGAEHHQASNLVYAEDRKKRMEEFKKQRAEGKRSPKLQRAETIIRNMGNKS